MTLRRTKAVALKEVRHILRDPRSLGLALAVPAMMLLLFGVALSLDVDRVPTLIYDANGTAKSRELAERFRGSRFFDVRGFAASYQEIEKEIDRSHVLLGVVIPNEYSREISAGREAEVQILVDGSDSNTASIALGYAETLVRAYSFELRQAAQNRKGGGSNAAARLAAPIDARARVWYNPQLESKNYVIPGLIAVVLMIISALLTSLTIAREWEMGTMEQLLSTPLRPAEMVMGKMLAYFGVGALDTLVALAVGLLVFHVPFRGSALLLAASSCVYLCCAFLWGIFISAVTRSQLLAFQMGMLSSFLPAFLLSGFVYAIEGMPPAIQAISRIVPARYMVTILKGLFLKGVGLEVLAAEFAFLIAFGALVFAAATRKLGQRLA